MKSATCLLLLAFAGACCPAPGPEDGGRPTGGSTTGGGGTTGSGTTGSGSTTGGSGGSSSGGTTGADGSVVLPMTEQQLCQALWAGAARAEILIGLGVGAQTFNPPSGTYCPPPNAAQSQTLSAVRTYAQAELTNLTPPDGGWPDGSGPAVCDDPQNPISQFATAMAASIASGRATWDGQAAAACEQAMQESQYLGVLFLGDAGLTFPGEAQALGVDGGNGACELILKGQVAQGAACTYSFDCQPGLFCRPGGANSCAGSCAPQVADGQQCGVYDDCVSGDSCTSSTCQKNGGASLGGSGDGGPGANCQSNADCQPCLGCSFSASPSVCVLLGGADGGCGSSTDCAGSFLYCAAGSCEERLVPGEAGCLASAVDSCLFGWCLPADGGPLGTCMQNSATSGPCTGLGGCQSTDYCALPDGGLVGACVAVPGAGHPCGSNGVCAAGSFCDSNHACLAQLGAGATCASGFECVSGECQNGQCRSPCLSGGCAGNCNNGPGASLLLGLGGATILGRRRRRSRGAESASTP